MISNYATLQTEVASFLNRTDLTDAIKTFIQSAEKRLKRDRRTRKLQTREFLVSSEDTALPSDFQGLQSLYHNGPTFFFPLEIVSANELADVNRRVIPSGPPMKAAVLDAFLRVAPSPNAAYTLKMLYWRKIETLSDSNPTNWLLDSDPDIYLYATLLESGPFLKDDDRMALWRTEYDARLEELHSYTTHHQYGGNLVRQFKAIG